MVKYVLMYDIFLLKSNINIYSIVCDASSSLQLKNVNANIQSQDVM